MPVAKLEDIEEPVQIAHLKDVAKIPIRVNELGQPTNVKYPEGPPAKGFFTRQLERPQKAAAELYQEGIKQAAKASAGVEPVEPSKLITAPAKAFMNEADRTPTKDIVEPFATATHANPQGIAHGFEALTDPMLVGGPLANAAMKGAGYVTKGLGKVPTYVNDLVQSVPKSMMNEHLMEAIRTADPKLLKDVVQSKEKIGPLIDAMKMNEEARGRFMPALAEVYRTENDHLQALKETGAPIDEIATQRLKVKNAKTAFEGLQPNTPVNPEVAGRAPQTIPEGTFSRPDLKALEGKPAFEAHGPITPPKPIEPKLLESLDKSDEQAKSLGYFNKPFYQNFRGRMQKILEQKGASASDINYAERSLDNVIDYGTQDYKVINRIQGNLRSMRGALTEQMAQTDPTYQAIKNQYSQVSKINEFLNRGGSTPTDIAGRVGTAGLEAGGSLAATALGHPYMGAGLGIGSAIQIGKIASKNPQVYYSVARRGHQLGLAMDNISNVLAKGPVAAGQWMMEHPEQARVLEQVAQHAHMEDIKNFAKDNLGIHSLTDNLKIADPQERESYAKMTDERLDHHKANSVQKAIVIDGIRKEGDYYDPNPIPGIGPHSPQKSGESPSQ